jgi:hypothetical protein
MRTDQKSAFVALDFPSSVFFLPHLIDVLSQDGKGVNSIAKADTNLESLVCHNGKQ